MLGEPGAGGGRAADHGHDLPLQPAEVRTLSQACGLPLTSFRAVHVARCVARACARAELPDARALADRMAADAGLRRRFRRSVAVSTTAMFRDPAQFALLGRLLDDGARRSTPPAVWSVGASDGSELASLALLLDERGLLAGAFMLGSDLLPENVELARALTAERLGPAGARAVLRFEHRDVTSSSPPGPFDVVLCRNVLIHLDAPAREAMLARLVAGLAPGGLLLLGRSERLPRPAAVGLVDAGANAYRRLA